VSLSTKNRRFEGGMGASLCRRSQRNDTWLRQAGVASCIPADYVIRCRTLRLVLWRVSYSKSFLYV